MSDLTLEELLAVEHAGWASLCSGTGGAFYGELMTPDAVMVLVNGVVMDRAAVVDSLDQSPPWARYELSDARVVAVGEDASALVYRAVASRDDGSAPFAALMSSVYQRIDGRPRLALYQQTMLTR